MLSLSFVQIRAVSYHLNSAKRKWCYHISGHEEIFLWTKFLWLFQIDWIPLHWTRKISRPQNYIHSVNKEKGKWVKFSVSVKWRKMTTMKISCLVWMTSVRHLPTLGRTRPLAVIRFWRLSPPPCIACPRYFSCCSISQRIREFVRFFFHGTRRSSRQHHISSEEIFLIFSLWSSSYKKGI